MEIQGIDVHGLANGAHFNFMKDSENNLGTDTAVGAKMAELTAAFKNAVAAEDNALIISRKSLFTEEIAAADQLQDRLHNSLKNTARAIAEAATGEMKTAAARVYQRIKDFNINTAAQLDREAGLMLNLVQALQSDLAADLETTGLTGLTAQLQAANATVREKMGGRIDEALAKPALSLRQTRRLTDEAYRTLVKHINAHALLEGDAPYAAAIGKQNEIIKHYKQQALTNKNTAETPPTAPEAGA